MVQDNQLVNAMQNRENNLNFLSTFSGDNQLPKITPIGSGIELNVLTFN